MNNKIVSIGTMYLDINCVNFPFDNALFAHRETVGKSYQVELGGSALNFAKISAQLGMDVSFIGMAGDDEIAQILTTKLKSNNVTPLISYSRDVQTNLAVHYVHKDGSSIMTSSGTANQSLSAKDTSPYLDKALSDTHYLYLGGVFKVKKLLPDLLGIVKKAKEKNVKVVLDHGRVNNEVDQTIITSVINLFPFVDIYLPSVDEFLAIWNVQNVEEGMSMLREKANPLTVIKMAEKGAIGYDNDKTYLIPSYNVKVLNTVGAGDSFNAGLLKALSKGMTFKESIQYACAVAAIKISSTKDISTKEVLHLIKL